MKDGASLYEKCVQQINDNGMNSVFHGRNICSQLVNELTSYLIIQARTQDFGKGGSEYRVAVRPRQGGGCERGCAPSRVEHEAFTLWMI